MIARAVAVVLVVLPCVVCADELDPLLMLDRLQPVHDRWLQCAAGHAKQFLRTHESASAIADGAFKHCRPEEKALGRAMRQELSESSVRRVLATVRSQDRSNLIQAIQKLRAK